MIPRRVWLALLAAFLFHGLLILTARYRLSYDAYVHIFFGDHYAKNWWSLWDPRWYTGFFVSSYPPLVHQLIGLFSRLVGLDAAFALILWVTLTLYPLAVYAFSRVFAGRIISEYASLGAAFLPSIYLSAHIFGQLPFLFGTLLALFGAASLARYLKDGGALNLALTLALTTTTMAAHHAVLLLQPFLLIAVTITHIRLSKSPTTFPTLRTTQHATLLLLTLCLLASLSLFWSTDWRTSLYVSLHFWLVFGLILSLRDFPHAWGGLMLGFCAALAMQIVTGIPEFALQTTRFLAPLGLNWPGPLDASVRGASIVRLADGLSFLRAYGTLPHPNILGGFALLFLLGPAALFLRKEKPNLLALLLFSLGVILLVLTFSRSAWLGFIFFLLVLVWKHKAFNHARLIAFIVVGVMSFALTLLPLQRLAQARMNDSTSNTEKFSITARNFLSQEALQMIRERPLTGVGIGGFVLQLAERAGEGYIIEPVHNLFLLAGAELGIPGLLILVGLVILLARGIAKTKKLESVLAGATLTGLGVIGLFDHYLWTLAPGRLMLGLALGLWVGQAGQHDA